MSSNKQPKTEKLSTSTTQLVMAPTFTHSTEIATALPTTAPSTLDALPDEILINIAEFTGAHSCYLGYGTVNKRINQLFNTYSTKLWKSTSYGGYVPFQEIVKECGKELERGYSYSHRFHRIASGAVTFNREDLLEWVIEKKNKFIFREICKRAIKDEKLSIFKQVWNSIENENMMTYMKEETDFIYIAAEKGNLNWLIYLREELECEWDWEACSSTAGGGHLDCLVYLHEQGCEWNEIACSYAAEGGHLDCLVYLHEHGCKWFYGACADAARNGHLDCLVYLHKNGCEWNEEACREAALSGHLDCLVYLHEQGCPWNKYACTDAARNGHLDCLMYLHEHGCEWDEYACRRAAASGHLDCLVYLHEHGCELDEGACSEAAGEGHLHCLVYLYEQRCPWNKWAYQEAARGGHVDCLVYLHEEGCEWDESACKYAACGGHLDC